MASGSLEANFSCAGEIDVGDDERGAVVGEPSRDRAADRPRASGDEGDLPRKIYAQTNVPSLVIMIL